jgi:hypothetical protein
MKYKYSIISLLLLFFSVAAFFSGYEGSGLLEDQDQWKYTAVISSMMDDGEGLGRNEIVQADFYLYAIKFHPVFPSSMAVFFLLLLFFIGYPFKRKRVGWTIIAVYGIVFFLTFSITPTEEGTAIFLNSVKISSIMLILLMCVLSIRTQGIFASEGGGNT